MVLFPLNRAILAKAEARGPDVQFGLRAPQCPRRDSFLASGGCSTDGCRAADVARPQQLPHRFVHAHHAIPPARHEVIVDALELAGAGFDVCVLEQGSRDVLTMS